VHSSELLRGSSVAFVFRILGIGLGYVFTLFITHGYGAEAMGVFALSLTVLQIAAVFSRLGMDTALLRYTGENANKTNGFSVIGNIYKKILKVTLPVSALMAILLYLLSPSIAVNIFHKENMTTAFQLASLGIVPMVMLFVHKEALRGLKKIGSYSFFNSVAISMFASLSLMFIFLFDDISNTMPVIAQISAITIAAILAIWIWRKELKKSTDSIKETHTKAEELRYRTLLSVALPMMLASSLFMIMNWTDTLILGAFKNGEEVGIYNVALKVSMLTSIALMAINSIAAPKFAEMWGNKDMIGLDRVVKQSTKIIFWTSFPILIIFLIFPTYILKAFGNEFVTGATVLIILTFGQFINAISGSTCTILSMTGNQVIVQNILIFSIIINLILNYSLVENYGMIGVAVATVISTMTWNFSMIFFIWKKFGFVPIKILDKLIKGNKI
jgi:O-antigen/teichoic acid export membrane protein